MIEFTSHEHIVTAHEIPICERLAQFARLFGRHVITVESAIYDTARELCPDYDGGFWRYWTLSNSGFYMAPTDGPYRLAVTGNGFDGLVSADTMGIIVCLFVYSRLSFQFSNVHFGERYHQLRDYALSHGEAGVILAAID